MKEKKITADMSEEEKTAALDYNMKLGEAKKAHTREQNRVSAQKSRAKKAELLAKSEERAQALEGEIKQIRRHRAALELRVQQLTNINLQLRAENDSLQFRLAVLEGNMQGNPHVPIRNPFASLPQIEVPSQNPSPAVTRAQAMQTEATQTEVAAPTQPPQGQGDIDASLTTAADTSLSDLGLPLVDPNLWVQLPTTNDAQDPALQPQDLNTLLGDAQQDEPFAWLTELTQQGTAPDTDNQQPGDPSNEGAQ